MRRASLTPLVSAVWPARPQPAEGLSRAELPTRRLSLARLGALALLGGAGLAAEPPQALAAGSQPANAPPPLSPEQSRRFLAWMTALIHQQIDAGPSPRWTQRDCAGLVRFAVAEALRPHDAAWRRSMGLVGKRLPPEPELSPEQTQALRHTWRRMDGSQGAFASALDLVQANTRRVSRQISAAQPGDLLFFDLGEAQHLMVWMGPYIAYHTGHVEPGDNGLRALRVAQLMAWPDTRWRPQPDNPDFAGVHRLAFVA